MAGLDIIVNADDLGISREVNAATFDLIAKGRIRSATIMANAPATREAARQAAWFPACSFGVHLNLTLFEPLTAGAGARLLVDERGQMSRANERARPGLDRLRAVYQELCAQIERIASLGVRISHLDSHNHVHTRSPLVFPALKEVQRRYHIRRVRLSKNFYAPDTPCAPNLLWKKRAYNWALQSIYFTHTTDVFTEFLTWHRAAAARQRSIGCIELMVHPGAAYAAEETAILDSDWTARLHPRPRLISYAQLA
jgi:chitin disaccharide deacetylase